MKYLKLLNWTARGAVFILFVSIAVFIAIAVFKMDIINSKDNPILWVFRMGFSAVMYVIFAVIALFELNFTKRISAIITIILSTFVLYGIVDLIFILWELKI